MDLVSEAQFGGCRVGNAELNLTSKLRPVSNTIEIKIQFTVKLVEQEAETST